MQLLARRDLRARTQGAEPEQPPGLTLGCGAVVTLRYFRDTEGGYQELSIRTELDSSRIAEEIFGGEGELRESPSPGLYLYIRRMTA